MLEQENQGLAMSRNNGIRASNGKYILPLDSDDLIEPTYLEKAVKYHEENPDTKVVYCKADRFDQKNESWDLPDYKYEDEIWTNRIFCSAVYKRCDYDKTIGYNPNMKGGYEDWDFWLSLLDRDSKVYRIPEVLFHYRFQRNSMVTKSDTMRPELYRKIYHNHPHIYEDYIQDIILYKNTLIEQDKVVNAKIVKVLRKIYGIVGGTPQYLLQINDKLSVEDNIKNTYLNPTSFLFEEPTNLLKQEVREPAIYTAIITAIATGASRMSEISTKVGEDTNVCTSYIKNLINLGIVQKETPYGEKNSRKSIYYIEDNMFRFWYRFVLENNSLIVRGAADRVYKRIEPYLSNYMQMYALLLENT